MIIIPRISKKPDTIKGTTISITGELVFEKASEFSGSSVNIITKSISLEPIFSISKFNVSDCGTNIFQIKQNQIEHNRHKNHQNDLNSNRQFVPILIINNLNSPQQRNIRDVSTVRSIN